MKKASIIIPCFNHGQFIDEAVQSVLEQTYENIEIIVINDGSTDPFTVEKLSNYRPPKTTVIHTENQGLPSARNTGIRAAEGEYILPLDADDRIGPRYIEDAVRVLETRPEVGIVYCEAELFGDESGKWLLPPYSLENMMVDNVIFCSGMFRRAEWEKVGGYDESLGTGWEDYDFWLSLIELGKQVYQIPEVHFYYRIRSDSMIRSLNDENKITAYTAIFMKHQNFFHENIDIWLRKMLYVFRLEHEVNQARAIEDELNMIKNSVTWRLAEKMRNISEEKHFIGKIHSFIVKTLIPKFNI